MGLVKKVKMVLFVLFMLCGTGYASWSGPTAVVTGTWGTNPGQFAIDYQDTHDIFPTTFSVSSEGIIAISEDQILKRIQFFQDGSLKKVVNTFAFDLIFLNGDLYVSGGGFRKYDSTGNLIWSKSEMSFAALFSTVDGNVIGYNRKENKYYLYSPAGNVIKVFSSKPLELGIVSEKAVAENQYKISIKYPDKTYELTSDATFMKYVRDTKGSVYGIDAGGVWKFTPCGKKIAELIMPVGQTETITSKTSGKSFALPVEYGQPVVASNGDVYAWTKSKLKYSIVKWTWVDDPNVPTGPDAPSGLTVTPSTSGLYLAWKASPNDPGCVTGYEVARATTSGGVFSTVGAVDKGVLKYNDATAEVGTQYYYKVRAMAGNEFSPYIRVTAGKR